MEKTRQFYSSYSSSGEKKLKNVLVKPHVLSNQLRGFENHYKIKLRASGYWLVYEVIAQEICIIVIAIGKRNKNQVYKQAKNKTEGNIH